MSVFGAASLPTAATQKQPVSEDGGGAGGGGKHRANLVHVHNGCYAATTRTRPCHS